jgi:hypothetical protein
MDARLEPWLSWSGSKIPDPCGDAVPGFAARPGCGKIVVNPGLLTVR